MGKTLYVGNLAASVTEATLSDLFSKSGTVTSTKVVQDRETGASKGFAFVEMSNEWEAARGILDHDRALVDGCSLRVNAARTETNDSGPRRAAALMGNRGRY